MSEWKSFKLSELGQIIGGSTPSTRNSMNYEGGHISWITPKDLSNHSRRFIAQGARNITEQGLKNCSAQLIPKNSILFSSRAPIGYLAIAEKELCTNQGFKSIVPNDRTNYMFLYYLLKFNKEKIEYISSGTTFKEISGSAMKKFSVCVPPLETQKKIAAVLSALDDKIELNNAINKNLEEQAQAIFDEFYRKADEEVFLGKTCKCELGGTPSRKNLEYWNGNISWINSGEVNKFRIIEPSEKITELGLKKSATKLLPAKTTVIAITGATLGQVSLLEIESCANQSVVGIIPNKKIPYEYIYPLVKMKISELLTHQTGGAQQHINKRNVEDLSIKILSPNFMKKYLSIVSGIYELISNICFENQKLGELRDALLPRLMSGEIDVSAVEI